MSQVFNRYEKKYLLDESTYREVRSRLVGHMVADKFGDSDGSYTITISISIPMTIGLSAIPCSIPAIRKSCGCGVTANPVTSLPSILRSKKR